MKMSRVEIKTTYFHVLCNNGFVILFVGCRFVVFATLVICSVKIPSQDSTEVSAVFIRVLLTNVCVSGTFLSWPYANEMK